MPMDPFGLHHNQDMISSHVTLESMLVGSKAAGGADQESKVDNKKANRPADEALKCPRCDSSNTKFCYYNNYSLTQPRYFCKSCRRYWTKGGTLRNVPVGGGCRKNKRSSSSKIRTTHQDHTPNLLSYDNSTADLSLAFATLQNGQLGFDHDHIPMLTNMNPHGSSFYDASRCGFVEPPPITSSLNNMYYGGENFENVGHVMMGDQEIGNMPYEDLISSGEIVTSHVKLEGCGDGGACSERADGDDGMVFCGNPWEIGGGEDVGGSRNNNFMGDVGRQSSWINGLRHWHGPLNTPLT